MSETGNIEDLAKIVSKEIFQWFKWNTCSLKDVDCNCVLDHHEKKTHPADVVFHYSDPYSGKTIYVNTDLKSYKKSSINATKITGALKSLSVSTECAHVSEDWQTKFIVDETSFSKVVGLLFIYNHDNEFDKDLIDVINAVKFEKVAVPENVTLIVFDPSRINVLVNVVNDIKGLIADKLFPDEKEDYSFFYPDMVMSRRSGEKWSQPASFEALTSPWLILRHKKAKETDEGFLIYYHKLGDTVEEFVYFIDALSHYQMLLSEMPIRVRLTNPGSLAANNFEKAKAEYLKIWGADGGRRKQLERIDVKRISKVISSYCPMEIGMRDI